MKKLYTVVFISLLFSTVKAQVSNNSFESWHTTTFDEPTGWQTGNKESVNTGLTPVTKVAGVNGHAVRMQTLVSIAGDTAQAYIANGDPMRGEGGIPVNGQPTAITGQYRYNIPNNDTALILLVFKQNGIVFNSTVFKIKGTGSQNTFTQFNFPISLNLVPDSVIFAATSSNLLDNVGIESGSFLEIDGISFTGINSPINNNEFENWTTTSNDAIIGWESYGDGVTKTTDAHDGNFAISLATTDYGNGNIGSAGITNGHSTQNGAIGGIPFNLTVDTLTGWFKYTSQCSDTGYLGVTLSANGMQIGGSMTYLSSATQYTYFEIPIYSQSTPDTLRIDASSSKWPYTNSCDGSTLIIDQLALKSELLASISKLENKKSPFAYPNPASNFIHINSGKLLTQETTIEFFDLSGRLVAKEVKQENSDDAINISTLINGRYYYRLTSSHGETMNSFIKQ